MVKLIVMNINIQGTKISNFLVKNNNYLFNIKYTNFNANLNYFFY